MNGEKPACIVLAGESWGGALHAVRSLGSRGVPVFVAVEGHGAAVYGRSRFCSAARDIESRNGREFCHRVAQWSEQIARGGSARGVMIVPLSDRHCELLHTHRDLFSSAVVLAVPDREVAPTVLDKVRTCAAAERAGLSVPRWTAVSDDDGIRRAGSLALPVVVRPTSWASVGSAPFKFEVFRTREALEAGLRSLLERGARLLAQEYVSGPDDAVEWGVLYRSRNGRLSLCTGRKARQDARDGGVMVWGTASVLPHLEPLTSSFVREVGFFGLGGIEFKRHAGRSWFIEFNPRLEAIHFLASRAGVDTLWMAYRELMLGDTVRSDQLQRRATAMVGNALLNRLARTRNVGSAALDLVRFLCGRRKVCAVWSAHDPAPWLALTAKMAAQASARRTRHLVARREAAGASERTAE